MFLSIEDVEKKLNTSAASGLSRKAARAQLQKAGGNAFFLLPKFSIQDGIRAVLTQPSLILLLLLSCFLLLFDHAISGGALLGLTLVYTLAMIALQMWTCRIYRIPARAMRPQFHVIREGQMFLLDCTRLVPGDLVELEQGDIVPCDFRLVSAQELRVLTYLGQGNTQEEYVHSFKYAGELSVDASDADICSHTNMLYGGSVVEHGTARALVVETGCHTYIGALQGGFSLKNNQALPEAAQRVKKIATYIQIALLIAVLPILCVCLMMGKTEESLPTVFSILLSLCMANLVGHLDIMLHAGMAIGIHRVFGNEHSPERALIKTEKSPDQLSRIDVLLLLGTHAFSEQILPTEQPTKQLSLSEREKEDITRRQELRLVMGEHFLHNREACLQEMRDNGISPLLCMEEESRQTVMYIMRTGIAERASEIALASQFRAEKRAITAGFGQYRAYCGFSMEEIRALMIALQKHGKKVAVLGNLPRESALLKHADVRFTCANDLAVFADSPRNRETKPQTSRGRADVATHRMRQHADVIIPCANRRHGGLAAIVYTIQTVVHTGRNVSVMSDYLIFSQLLRMALVLPTLLVATPGLNAVQILFSGFCFDLLLSLLLLTRKDDSAIGSVQQDYRFSWKATVVEAISIGILTLSAYLFIYYNATDTSSATSSLFLALLLIQLTSCLIRWRPLRSLRHSVNRRTLLLAVIVIIGFLLIAWMFGWLSPLGLTVLPTPFNYVAMAGPLAVILVHCVIHFYQVNRNR